MRHLPIALKEHFDAELLNTPLFIDKKNPKQMLIETVNSCVGITEVGGDNKGTLVELFQSATSSPMEQAWCLDFIQACIAYVEAVTGLSCPLPATEHVLTLWNSAKAYSAVQPPSAGDLILWRFGSTSKGHCGVIIGQDSLRYKTVEGNTGPGGEIERNGDGVYQKYRAKGGSKTFVEVGFLQCFP